MMKINLAILLSISCFTCLFSNPNENLDIEELDTFENMSSSNLQHYYEPKNQKKLSETLLEGVEFILESYAPEEDQSPEAKMKKLSKSSISD